MAASSSSAVTNVSSVMNGGGRDQVYVAAVALRASKGPGQLLMSAAYSLNLWNLQHFMVLIKPSSPPPNSPIVVFDFQPVDPEDIFVALAALSGRSVPGIVQERKLRKLPRERCWCVGSSEVLVDSLDMASNYNQTWNTDLIIGRRDCRDYTNGLVEYLTGEENILERLRSSART